jgi:CRP-like cAMP-binding protein
MPTITECRLFSGIPQEKLIEYLKKINLRVQKVERGEIVAFEGDDCSSIGMILAGQVSVYQLQPSGKKIVIDTLHAGGSFGEVIIFSDQRTYPATIEAAEDGQIAFLSREDVMTLCNLSPEFLGHFMGLLSNKILMLNRKVKSLSLHSPRLKAINFILENYSRQKTLQLHFNESRLEMAEKLGLPRPSLSRELMKLKALGWIDYDGASIKILDLERLSDGLNESSD